MPIGNVLLKPVFDILNFEIKILATNNGGTIKIPLYAIVILLFVVEFCIILWQSFMSASGHGFGRVSSQSSDDYALSYKPKGLVTGIVIHERRFKK